MIQRFTAVLALATSVVSWFGAVSFASVPARAQEFQRIEIAHGWKIKGLSPRATLDRTFLDEAAQAPETSGWLAVSAMPAMVHDILLHSGKIETPWLPGNAAKCRWVAEQDWVYAVHFSVPKPGPETWLRFNGLDTVVDVYLNHDLVASHSNMYVPLAVNISGHLQTENTLVLHFHTVFDLSHGKPGPLKVVGGEPSRLVRRPSGNYGTYLGPSPYFSRVGVYDRVFLEITDGSAMTEAVADASLNEALTEGVVKVDVAGFSRLPTVAVQVKLLGPEGHTVGEASTTGIVHNGVFSASPFLRVEHPRLWWPRGYGDQPLYRADITLLTQGRPHQVEKRTLGFRRVTMPSRLHFVVNGVPVRLWGAAWVTPNWQTAVWDQPRVERLFAMAENANFNAFRVWGEVESPRDEFYELADAKGFLLWQDFTDLPLAPDEISRAVCRREAEQFIKRLKHHPSILSWCGKNEAAMWSYKDYNADFQDHGAWPGLSAAEEVGAICKQLDPTRYYQPSTPYYGAFPNDPHGGNTHGYTNMWFVPGYDYLNFASEDTRIAAPVLRSLQRFMQPEDLWPAGYSTLDLPGNRYPFPQAWLPYTTAEAWKKTGPVEQFYDAANGAALVYRLGMAEALYYRDTIERQRRGREAADPSGRRRCGGYMVWKFDDSWPQVYSAKVDYFLEPYHAYYTLRRAYAPVLLSFDIGTYIYLWAVNDSREMVTGAVKIRLLNLDNNEFDREIAREVTVPPGQSKVIVRLDEAGIASFRREHILFATLTDKSGRVIARANASVDIERRIAFPDAKLDLKTQYGVLVVTTDKFARSVTLEGDENGDSFGWFFEDNYFDLVPGEVKLVHILGQHSAGRITAKPWYSSQATTIDWMR